MNKFFIVIILLLSCFIGARNADASAYDNAYTFYTKYAKDSDKPVHLNKDDGYIYFCSWGSTASSATKYKTVGYSIRINVDGINDQVEVKLGGSIVKDVSTVQKGDYTYVLRRAKLVRLQTLFNGNPDITWNKIFRKKNSYDFNAIMTVSENGKDLCGSVYESSNLRSISADKNSYLYRTLSGIKNARIWANPDDLDNFYGKRISFEPVSPLEVSEMSILNYSDNIYAYNGSYYVRNNSTIILYFNSFFDDSEAVSTKYHPNFNLFKVSGWGDNLIFFERQGINGNRCRAGLFSGTYNNSPLELKYADNDISTVYEDDPQLFRSGVAYDFTVPDSNVIYVKSEGRVYYNNRYPSDESDVDDLCDAQTAGDKKLTLISDGKAPEISVSTYIYAPNYSSKVSIPVTVNDSLSGIRTIALYNSSGVLQDSINFTQKTNTYSSSEKFYVQADSSDYYYIRATDNVGNSGVSYNIRFMIPTNYKINVRTSGGLNGYNTTVFDVSVSGGSSQLCTFLIYSDPDQNVEEKRIIIANMDSHVNTFPRGLYSYEYHTDIANDIKDYQDGAYTFNVISGGEQSQAEPKYLYVVKDKTKPNISYNTSGVTRDGWFNRYVTVTVNVSDALSGVDRVQLFCNGEALEGVIEQQEYTAPINASYTVDNEGTSSITVKAKDIAGNEQTILRTIKIDTQKPYIEFFGDYEYIDVAGRWFGRNDLDNGYILIHDDASGMNLTNNRALLFVESGGTMHMVDYGDFSVSSVNNNTIRFEFTDAFREKIVTGKKTYLIDTKDIAGNEMLHTMDINFDCDPPLVTTVETDRWNPIEQRGSFIISDHHSGLKSYKVIINSAVVERGYYDGTRSDEMSFDLKGMTDEGTVAFLLVEDMVGNTTRYDLPIERSSGNGIGGKVRTRIR